jgi:hypothetical protein
MRFSVICNVTDLFLAHIVFKCGLDVAVTGSEGAPALGEGAVESPEDRRRPRAMRISSVGGMYCIYSLWYTDKR